MISKNQIHSLTIFFFPPFQRAKYPSFEKLFNAFTFCIENGCFQTFFKPFYKKIHIFLTYPALAKQAKGVK